MLQLPSDLLSLTNEAAALAQNGRLVYANAAALRLLGPDCTGKSLRALFGEELAETQAAGFAAAVFVGEKHCLLRSSRTEGFQVLFLSRQEPDESVFSDAWLQSLRTGLMNLNLAAEAGRAVAGELAHPELLKSFRALTKEYYSLNRLLSNVTAARGILQNSLPASFCSVDLGELCGDVIGSLRLLRPDVDFAFSCSRRVLLWADPALLELAVFNMLSNCLVHAVGLRRILLELQSFSDRVYLSVRDDGAGIPPERMNDVFQRFRSGFSLSELPYGAGLGLTVVRGVAEKHGGTVLLESRRDAGTLLRLSLSRGPRSEAALLNECRPYVSGPDRLLTAMAPCLPDECFSPPYLE
ncbi:MAG: sensor histidine kinase [Oscillospiraceae bacterium]|nr:sensor histidine kinase [Oscillospiraceae bacterium]